MAHYSILANALKLDHQTLLFIGRLKNLVVLDGAVNDLARHAISPDVLVGDFDSVAVDYLEDLYDRGCLVLKQWDQNKSDLMKGIEFCIARNAVKIDIYNALGARQDHHMLNLRLLKRYHRPKCEMKIINIDEEIRYCENVTVHLRGAIGSRASFMSCPSAVVSSQGLEYDMDCYQLSFALSESSSNKLREKKASVKINGGVFLITEKNVNVSYSLKE